MTPAALAICVTSIAWPAMKSAAVLDPALNPNHPTHRRLAPMWVSTSECGALGISG